MKLTLSAIAAGLATATACPFADMAADFDAEDIARAHSTSHTSNRVGGSTAHEIHERINRHLRSAAEGDAVHGDGDEPLLSAPIRECAEFTLGELNTLIGAVVAGADEGLQEIYESKEGHDGRRRRMSTVEEYEASWSEEFEALAEDASGALETTLRDAKCAEALMLWTHHLTTATQQALLCDEGEPVAALPTLPLYDEARAAASDVYAESFTCVAGHDMTSTPTDHVWPHWPETLHYSGKGHGPYPFWLGGDGDYYPGADIEVWWSETDASEKFYHSTCYMTEAGASNDGPCYHLLTGTQGDDAKGYLYLADESYCCESTSRGFGLSATQGDFMDDMTYQGEIDFDGDFYSGKAKKYTMQLEDIVDYFWYITDEDGKPIQQGEGGLGMDDDSGKGIQLWHEYNPANFTDDAINPTIPDGTFDIPTVCKTTRKSCNMP